MKSAYSVRVRNYFGVECPPQFCYKEVNMNLRSYIRESGYSIALICCVLMAGCAERDGAPQMSDRGGGSRIKRPNHR